MIEFVCDVADSTGVLSPCKLNARGRIKLALEVAAAHGIKAGSRGENIGGASQMGKDVASTAAVKPARRPRLVIRNKGESTASSEGQRGLLTGEALSSQNYFCGSDSQRIIMGRSEQPMEQCNSKKQRHQSGQVVTGSRYPDLAPLSVIGSPNSLVDRATWFNFKGNIAVVASTYSHFVPVYNFPVSPELRDYYKEIVEELGHVESTEVLSDRNNLISSVSTLVVVAKEMAEFGDECPSASSLEAWRDSFVLPRLLKFNMGWIEELFKGLEESRASRQLVLPGEIMVLKEEVKAETHKLKEQQKDQVRITAEASKIVVEVAATSTKLNLKKKELAEKEAELASFE
ncbi:hypothetical protein C5167_045250 [Papaver somniferum]|uniref:Uncharacterized protein n=1 Tax=Papaver somniferum TaxID=3469 RepID=A0A4Y7LAB4_PAPSO|nr:hypothetical protein C5167_045250 [Papaver somniferum]